MNFSGTFRLTLILSFVKKERRGLFTLTPALSCERKGIIHPHPNPLPSRERAPIGK
jgi:hypothetical protein